MDNFGQHTARDVGGTSVLRKLSAVNGTTALDSDATVSKATGVTAEFLFPVIFLLDIQCSTIGDCNLLHTNKTLYSHICGFSANINHFTLNGRRTINLRVASGFSLCNNRTTGNVDYGICVSTISAAANRHARVLYSGIYIAILNIDGYKIFLNNCFCVFIAGTNGSTISAGIDINVATEDVQGIARASLACTLRCTDTCTTGIARIDDQLVRTILIITVTIMMGETINDKLRIFDLDTAVGVLGNFASVDCICSLNQQGYRIVATVNQDAGGNSLFVIVRKRVRNKGKIIKHNSGVAAGDRNGVAGGIAIFSEDIHLFSLSNILIHCGVILLISNLPGCGTRHNLHRTITDVNALDGVVSSNIDNIGISLQCLTTEGCLKLDLVIGRCRVQLQLAIVSLYSIATGNIPYHIAQFMDGHRAPVHGH